MDFDGDGYPDYVTSTKNESIKVYHSRIRRTNLLKKVVQSTGASIELDYDVKNPVDQSVIGSTYKMPYKKWALTKVSVHDGFAGDGQDVTRYAYEYFNGYKDRKDRNFLGFGMTKAHLLDKDGWAYRTDITEYLLNDMTENQQYRPGTSSDLKQYLYKKGLPKKASALDRHKRLMNETVYTYKFYDSNKITGDINTTASSAAEVSVFTEKLSVLPLVTTIANKVVNFDEDTENSTFAYETLQRFNLYDRKGNVKKYVDVDRGLTVDITYNLGIKTLPINHRISKTSGGQLLRQTRADIDASGVKYGAVTKSFAISEEVFTKYEYDQLGNLIKTTLPGDFIYTYDYANSEYSGDYASIIPSRITDPFGNIFEIRSNAFGQPVRVKDVYGEVVDYKYDAFNRLLEFRGPYEADWTIRNKFVNNRVAITQHNLGQGNILHTSMINDGLGRTLQVKKQMLTEEEVPDCNNDSKYRMAVSGKTVYDEFGRAVENYLGDMQELCSSLAPEVVLESMLTTYYDIPTSIEKKIGRKYDNKDRVTEEMVYGTNALTQTKYAFGPDKNGETRFSQEVTLPEGNNTVVYTDKLGQTVFQKQIGEGENLWTEYQYDNLGQVLKVTNALNHEYSYSYDLLGRVTRKFSSAAGDSSFKYDALSQVIEKTDANGTTVE